MSSSLLPRSFLASAVLFVGCASSSATTASGPVVQEKPDELRDYATAPVSRRPAASNRGPVDPIAADQLVATEAETTAEIEPPAAVASLTVTPKGKGAKKALRGCVVTVDGTRMGKAPIKNADVPAGDVEVTVSCKGKRAFTRNLTLAAAERATLAVRKGDLRRRR